MVREGYRHQQRGVKFGGSEITLIKLKKEGLKLYFKQNKKDESCTLKNLSLSWDSERKLKRRPISNEEVNNFNLKFCLALMKLNLPNIGPLSQTKAIETANLLVTGFSNQ